MTQETRKVKLYAGLILELPADETFDVETHEQAMRPVLYVRADLPLDGSRCRAYRWQSNRRFRVGSAVTGIPGWGRVVVVDDPVTRHGVEHVPVAAPGWAFATEGEATG